MCVTLGRAELSQTTLYVGRASGVFTSDHRDIHVCGYQNRVQNLLTVMQRRDAASGKRNQGNAIILPFPAVPGTMSQKNFLTGMDVCPHVLKDMADAVTPRTRSSFSLEDSSKGSRSLGVEIFELDIYTVVLAQKAQLIADVIGDVSKEKRPPLKPHLFGNYDEWYPDWPIAVCCFNNEEAALANPIMAWYEPLRPEFLFAPALDCHTGDVPDLRAQVKVDHTLVVGAGAAPNGRGARVHYQDEIPAHIKPYLPNRVIGGQLRLMMSNGDFVFRTDQVEEGIFQPMRLLPPGVRRGSV